MVHSNPVTARKGPIPTKEQNKLWDLQVFLHNIWLEKIACDPKLYDDATVSHTSGQCPCGCTRTNIGNYLQLRGRKEQR